nr:hypothetical protein [Streptomyces sp. TLI_235]
MADAVGPVGGFFSRSTGPASKILLNLATLVPALLRPPPGPSRFAGQVEDPQTEPLEDTTRFTSAQWETAEQLMYLPGTVRSLSSLLEDAARIDPDLPSLVALLGVHAYSPDVGAALRRGDDHVRVAARTDSVLDSAGFYGDDLWLTTARLQPPDNSNGAARTTGSKGAGR